MGGTEVNALRLATGLCRLGHHPLVVHLATHGPLLDAYRDAGIETVGLPIPALTHPRAWVQAGRLFRLLRRQRVDVLHAQDVYGNVLGIPVARLAGVPLVMGSRRWWEPSHPPALALANRFAIRRAHALVSNAQAVAERAVREYGLSPARAHVVRNMIPGAAFDAPSPQAIAAQRAQWAIQPGGQVVGIVARLAAVKDHPTLLRAMALLRGVVPSLVLVVAGEGEQRVSLQALVRELGIEDCVRFIGPSPPGQNLHHYFDLSVLTSVSEASPNTLVEAMAAGRPIVATRVGGVAEIVEEGRSGLTVPPGDPAALAEAMKAVLGRRDLADRMGAAGRERAQVAHGEAGVLRRWEALYHSLLPGRATTSR